MLCALTVRQLEPGTFEQFAETFSPRAEDGVPAGWVRYTVLRDTADENRIVTFGFFDGTLDELERNQEEHGYAERRAEAEKYVVDVPVNGVFEVMVNLEAQAAR
jgi:hypothetical protein